MNNLARLNKVKADEAGVDGTTSLDAILARSVDEVSREFENETHREFAATLGTRYLQRHPRTCGDELWLDQDLASISGLTVDDDGDGTYELTLVENTDYFVEREDDLDSNTPIVCLTLNRNGTQLSSWPTAYRAVKVTGLWGYSYELQDATVDTAEVLDTTETDITIDLTAATLIFPGDTIVIESEQMEVTAVATTTLTVVRGINGTAAATHVTDSDIYVRRYPRDIEEIIAERVVGKRWDTQGGYDAGVTLTGESQGAAGKTTARGSFARWSRTVKRYKRWGVS